MRKKNFISGRSCCPACRTPLAWYDLIPVISWLLLRGRCRTCKASISYLYPFIEIVTAIIFSLAALYLPSYYLVAYLFFFSALIVSVRSDLETMLISRYVTLFLIPIGLLFSATGLLPISFSQSLLGSIIGYLLLWFIAKIFFILTRKEGIGQGDLELLAFIGSFTGPVGAWYALLFGSLTGSVLGVGYILITKSGKNAKIPFGPFLAIGAALFVFLQGPLMLILLGQ